MSTNERQTCNVSHLHKQQYKKDAHLEWNPLGLENNMHLDELFIQKASSPSCFEERFILPVLNWAIVFIFSWDGKLFSLNTLQIARLCQ